MNNDLEHIYKGIGWYLYNGKFIEDNYDKIIFVGSIENMDEDIIKLYTKSINMGIPIFKDKDIFMPKIRENTNNNDLYLSELAINNLINFYKETDYKALYKMVQYKLISDELYKKYFSYL
jgi:hypothetical protein